MQAQPAQDVTAILRAWTGGDERALDRLLPVLYEELRRTARAYMRRERSGHTLQTTALVNEVFLRLVDIHQVEWHDRVHFLTMAAQLMRRILVDHARRRGYRKRGGGERPVPLDESAMISPGWSSHFVALLIYAYVPPDAPPEWNDVFGAGSTDRKLDVSAAEGLLGMTVYPQVARTSDPLALADDVIGSIWFLTCGYVLFLIARLAWPGRAPTNIAIRDLEANAG